MSAVLSLSARVGRQPVELPEVERRRMLRFFERNPLIEGLAGPRPQTMLGRISIVNIRRRKPIWQPGERSDYVYFVRSGAVRVSRTTETGRELIEDFYAKNTLIGVDPVLSGAPHDTLAVAHEDLTVYALHRDDLLALIRSYPEFGLRLAEDRACRRRIRDARVAGLIYKSAPARLAALFVELSDEFGVQDSRGIILNLKLTHRELGALIGVTRETASFVILDMRKAGLIENERKRVVLCDLERLRDLATAPDGGVSLLRS